MTPNPCIEPFVLCVCSCTLLVTDDSEIPEESEDTCAMAAAFDAATAACRPSIDRLLTLQNLNQHEPLVVVRGACVRHLIEPVKFQVWMVRAR